MMCYDDRPEYLTDASLKYHVYVLERFSTTSSKNTFDITEKIHKVRLNIKVDNTNTNRYGCTSLKKQNHTRVTFKLHFTFSNNGMTRPRI